MTRIALLSDTHGWLDDAIFPHIHDCDEVLHAGDFGSMDIITALEKNTGHKVRGVYGNIDGQDIRSLFPEELFFTCEKVGIYMKHIGGYPGRYAPGVGSRLKELKPALFISGHSHIVKVQYDPGLACLHMNPGAAGKQGWHKVRTILRFVIDGATIKNCELIELGKR